MGKNMTSKPYIFAVFLTDYLNATSLFAYLTVRSMLYFSTFELMTSTGYSIKEVRFSVMGGISKF